MDQYGILSTEKPGKTLDELLVEFKRSGRKSFHGFCDDSHGNSMESKFWEWMESTSTKYDENGHAITTKPSHSGLVHRWLMKPPSDNEQRFGVCLLIAMVLTGIILGVFF